MADPDPDSDPSSVPDYPTPLQKRLIWTGLASFGAVLTGAIAVGLILLVSWVLGFLQPVLVPVAVAAILAYLLNPIVRWVRHRPGWDRRRAVYAVFTGFLALALLLSFLVVYPVARQAREFWVEYLVPQDDAPLADTSSPDIEGAPGDLESSRSTWIARTKLGHKSVELLDYLDERLGNLPFFEQFKNREDLSQWDVGEISNWLWSRLSGIADELTMVFGRGFSSAGAVLGYLLGFILVPIYLFFFLRESITISRRWSDFIPLRQSPLKREIVETLQDVNQYLIAYFRGQMVVSIIDGALVALALSLIGLPYALLLGVLLAILGLIPFIGTAIVMIPAVIISVVHFGHKITVPASEIGRYDPARIAGEIASSSPGGGIAFYEIYDQTWSWLPHQIWVYPLIVLTFFIVLQQVNSLVTAPRIVGNSVGLHPLTVIFSMLFWGLLLGGLLGALIAVPLTASVKVLFRRYIWERRIAPPSISQSSPGPLES